MLLDETLFGTVDKIKRSVDRLQYFEPPEGYYLAFSGGKDSQCIYHLAKEARVKFDAHYNLPTVDPPELVRFIKNNYPDVSIDSSGKTMWKLVEKKGLPTRLKRWCCSELKEYGGEGRICVTGVRWAESNARSKRTPYEIVTPKIKDKKLFNDNDDDRRLFENCMQKGKRVVNPIIDWGDSDVWEYLKSRNIESCKLYEEGFKRLGCIGCPMAGKQRIGQFERWPKYFDNYKRAATRFLPGYIKRVEARGTESLFKTVDEMMNWWLYGKEKDTNEDQLNFDLEE